MDVGCWAILAQMSLRNRRCRTSTSVVGMEGFFSLCVWSEFFGHKQMAGCSEDGWRMKVVDGPKRYPVYGNLQ
ncbi:hypothetical protein CEXT_763881 [Caerostris extrusa]|uniref:Uncharacterized protein n=1 Tax=Caerostris extrusa TaxID=172846 RepID=A0AAV4RXS4_CAEEX|nr:hypothetical protein CEXT_763881 [Caerostris extrusa]